MAGAGRPAHLPGVERRRALKRSIAGSGKRGQEREFPTCRCRERGYIAIDGCQLARPESIPCSPRRSSVASPTQASISWSRCWSSAASTPAPPSSREGEPGRSMFIVHAGHLVVSKLGDAGRSIADDGSRARRFLRRNDADRNAEPVGHRRRGEPTTVLYELTARDLYAYYKADIHAYVMVMQNINRELCRRLRRADRRIAELSARGSE